jgi:hypothetical protein
MRSETYEVLRVYDSSDFLGTVVGEIFAFSKVAAIEEKQGFLHSFPVHTIAYTSRAVIFGHVLVSWKT